MPTRDPDDVLVVVFKHHAVLNETKTAAEGRPQYDDVEVVEIRAAGSRNTTVQPATAVSHWATDPVTGAQTRITYAERFPKQYQQFKARVAQTIAGTPLEHVPFLTEARRAELRALNVYTAEQLAGIDGQELKNLGNGGRELKNKVIEWMAEAKEKNAPNLQMAAELEAMRSRMQLLQEDNELLRRAASAEQQFDEMSDTQLRDFIKSHSGHAPQGNLSHKMLVRMALDCRPKAAA